MSGCAFEGRGGAEPSRHTVRAALPMLCTYGTHVLPRTSFSSRSEVVPTTHCDRPSLLVAGTAARVREVSLTLWKTASVAMCVRGAWWCFWCCCYWCWCCWHMSLDAVVALEQNEQAKHVGILEVRWCVGANTDRHGCLCLCEGGVGMIHRC